MKIILVDDDRFALEAISHMLHWERFDGELAGCATNGTEAIALLNTQHPDVVISDTVCLTWTAWTSPSICTSIAPTPA